MANYEWTNPGVRSAPLWGNDTRGADQGYDPGGGGGNGPLAGTPAPPPSGGPHMPVGRSEGLGSWQPYENYLYTRPDTHGGRQQAPEGGYDRPTKQAQAEQPQAQEDNAADPQAAQPAGYPLVPGPGIGGFLFGIK